MTYTYQNAFYTLEKIQAQELADVLSQGWELVSMVPFKMTPEAGSTIVREYLVTLRQESVPVEQVGVGGA